MLIDGHNDLAWAMRARSNYELKGSDFAQVTAGLQTDLARMRRGGVTGQFWSVYAPSTLSGPQAATVAIEQIMFIRGLVERFPHDLAFATSAKDIIQAQKEGRIASLLGMEGGHCIDESLTILRMMFALGVRYMTLTHNHNTAWADSATDEVVLGGLSVFGKEVVREMNRLGMLVDLSHVSTNVMYDALAITLAPVIFSHSCARALVDVPRNVPDDVLSLLANNGGVCMVAFVSDFVSAEHAAWSSGREQGVGDAPAPTVSVDDVADHIDHIRNVAGVHHVGIGADFDGSADMPADLGDVSAYPVLLKVLAERGWSAPDLELLTGGNILRVFAQAEEIATAG